MNNDRYRLKVYEEKEILETNIEDILTHEYFLLDLDYELSKQGDPSLHDFLAATEAFAPEGM